MRKGLLRTGEEPLTSTSATRCWPVVGHCPIGDGIINEKLLMKITLRSKTLHLAIGEELAERK